MSAKFILKSFAKCPKQLVVKYSDPQSYSRSTLPKKTEVLADDYYTSVLLPTLTSISPNYITFNCWAVVSTSTPVSTSTQIKENNVNLKAVWNETKGILYVYNNLDNNVTVDAYDSSSVTLLDSISVLAHSYNYMLNSHKYFMCYMLQVSTTYDPSFMITLRDNNGSVLTTVYAYSYTGNIPRLDYYSPYNDHMTLSLDYIAESESESESESYEESESESSSDKYIEIYNNTVDFVTIEAYNSWGTILDSVTLGSWTVGSILTDSNFNDCYYINVVHNSGNSITGTLKDNFYNIIDSQSSTSTLSFNGIYTYNYYPMPLRLEIISEGESESESGSGGENVIVHNNSPYTIYISVDSSSSYDVYGYSDYLIAQASNYYLIDPGGIYVTVVTEDSYGNVIDNRAVTTYDYFYDYYKTIKTIRIYGGSESESESGGESEWESESGYESESESGGDFEYDTILVSQVEVLSTDTFQILFDAASLNDTVNIDWGDGTVETFPISDCMYTVDGDCYKVTLSHMYSQTGTYTITHSYNCYAPYDTTDDVDVIGTRVYMWPRETYRVISFDIQKSADHRKINPSFLKNEGTSTGSYSGNPSLQYVNFGTGVTHVTSNGLNNCSNFETLLMPGITDATSDFDIYDSPIKTLDIGYKSSIQTMLYTFDEGTIETLYLRSTSVVAVDSDEVEYLPSDLANVQTIYVPVELLSAYQNDSVWGQFFSKFAPLGGESESESESGSEDITEFYFYIEGDSSKYQYSFIDNLSYYQENAGTDKIRVVVTSNPSGFLKFSIKQKGVLIKINIYDKYNNLISSATNYTLEDNYGLNGSTTGVNIYAGYTIEVLHS